MPWLLIILNLAILFVAVLSVFILPDCFDIPLALTVMMICGYPVHGPGGWIDGIRLASTASFDNGLEGKTGNSN